MTWGSSLIANYVVDKLICTICFLELQIDFQQNVIREGLICTMWSKHIFLGKKSKHDELVEAGVTSCAYLWLKFAVQFLFKVL